MKKVLKKGFTLVELVIVVAIIGMLVAIAVPKFSKASETAKVRRIEADARAIASSAQLYYASEGSYPEKMYLPGTNIVDETKAVPAADITKILNSAGIKSDDISKWKVGYSSKDNTLVVTFLGADKSVEQLFRDGASDIGDFLNNCIVFYF